MQTQNPFLDDLAKVAAGAVGGLAGIKHEIETRLREQFERILGRMDLVTREEFEVVKAMAAKARDRAGGDGGPAGRARGQAGPEPRIRSDRRAVTIIRWISPTGLLRANSQFWHPTNGG